MTTFHNLREAIDGLIDLKAELAEIGAVKLSHFILGYNFEEDIRAKIKPLEEKAEEKVQKKWAEIAENFIKMMRCLRDLLYHRKTKSKLVEQAQPFFEECQVSKGCYDIIEAYIEKVKLERGQIEEHIAELARVDARQETETLKLHRELKLDFVAEKLKLEEYVETQLKIVQGKLRKYQQIIAKQSEIITELRRSVEQTIGLAAQAKVEASNAHRTVVEQSAKLVVLETTQKTLLENSRELKNDVSIQNEELERLNGRVSLDAIVPRFPVSLFPANRPKGP